MSVDFGWVGVGAEAVELVALVFALLEAEGGEGGGEHLFGELRGLLI